MIFKAFEPHDLVGAFAVWADRLRRKLIREWRAEMSAGTPETPETPTPMGWSSTKISIQSTIGAFKLCLKKSSPWPFYWKSGPKRCGGHSGLPGTMETWPSLATAATRRGHGCECQSLEAPASKELWCFFRHDQAGQQAHGQNFAATWYHSDCCSAN